MKAIRNRWLFLCDIIFMMAAYALGTSIVYPLPRVHDLIFENVGFFMITAAIYITVMIFGGCYQVLWNNVSSSSLIRLVHCLAISCVASMIIGYFFSVPRAGLRFSILLNIEIPLCILGLRLLLVILDREYKSRMNKEGLRTLVIGAGELGVILMREINRNKNIHNSVVGFADDDKEKLGRIVYGKKVLGTCKEIPEICKKYDIEEIIFAIHTIDQKSKLEIMNICSETGLKVKMLMSVDAVLEGNIQSKDIRDVQIEDLLERDPVSLENELISEQIKDRVVMVTGGGGSIGSELCRQIIKFEPEKLIILDIYENTTYVLQQELEEQYPKQNIEVLIASVRDIERLESIFDKFRPDLIFHAAAHKHVPLMEYSPCEAVKNNVFGTYNVAKCAEKYAAKKMVLISTDKAVNPTNAMGASKRLCEIIIEAFAGNSDTQYAAVRFGNVLGSNGSVVPRFQQQIAQGGPVTVTHKEITRFFMTIPEASQLVLQAMAYAKGGEIFILDMGMPVKIYDLAEKMIRLSGHTPNVDIPIKITGLRPGEKLYEEILMNEEGITSTHHEQIYIGRISDITMEELEATLDSLREVTQSDEIKVKTALAKAVPSYEPRFTKESAAAN